MKHDLDTALDQCLDSLRQSRDLDACLASYPQYADELRPLLDMAVDVGWVSAPAPTATARAAGEERMLAALARVTEQRSQLHPLLRAAKWLVGLFTRPGSGLGLAWKWAAATMAVLLVAACGLTLAASAGSLPGDALYPVKLAGQRAQLALTFDPASQRSLAEQFDAQQRSDVEAILGTGRQVGVDFRGILERMEDAVWIVGGLPVTVGEATTVVGQPHPGAMLRVRGELPGDGTLFAVRVEVVSDATPLPTPSPQPTGTPQPPGTVEATEGVETDEATESGDVHETPLPTLTASPQPDDEGAAEEATETPAIPEPSPTPAVQETPDPIDGPQPGESAEPQDTPAAIEEPEPEDTPEVEGTPEATEDPDSDEEPEPEDTPEATEDPDSDEEPGPEDTPDPGEDPDSDEEPGPEDTPDPDEDPDSGEQPEPEDTPEPAEDPGSDEQPEPEETPEPVDDNPHS